MNNERELNAIQFKQIMKAHNYCESVTVRINLIRASYYYQLYKQLSTVDNFTSENQQDCAYYQAERYNSVKQALLVAKLEYQQGWRLVEDISCYIRKLHRKYSGNFTKLTIQEKGVLDLSRLCETIYNMQLSGKNYDEPDNLHFELLIGREENKL